MSVAKQEINSEEVSRILNLDEGHFLDFKSREIAPASLTKTLSAFSNADGGELYVGISELKKGGITIWEGFQKEELANGHLQAIEQFFPLGQEVSCSFLSCTGRIGLVLYISILKSRSIKRASDGKLYVRRGAQNLPIVGEDAVERLKLNKGLISYESNTLSFPSTLITASNEIEEFIRQVVPSSEPIPWLKKQQLIIDEKPTVAGILLFADEPQVALPKSAIKIYRYKTRDAQGTRDTLIENPITVEGALYVAIKTAVDKTSKIIETIGTLGHVGFEKVAYPFEALHEIVTNAVLHRDYSLQDDVHIRVFDNRVEVESPGSLPAHITVENILEERFARNGVLVRLINKFPNPPNKDVGEGLNTAFQAMKRMKLKEPLIEQRENSVRVVIRHEPLASPEQIVMAYLDQNAEINNSKGREICGIASENIMKNVFKRLIKSKMIQQIPNRGGSKSAYRKRRPRGPKPKKR